MGPPTKERPGSRPGRSESADEARHAKSTTVRIHCKLCGAEALGEARAGVVERVTLHHDPDCVYLAAVDAGAAPAFCARFGIPLEFTALEPVGSA